MAKKKKKAKKTKTKRTKKKKKMTGAKVNNQVLRSLKLSHISSFPKVQSLIISITFLVGGENKILHSKEILVLILTTQK